MYNGYQDPIAGIASLMLSSDDFDRIEAIDRRICSLATQYSPERWIVPSLISDDVLRRTGHLQYFPHQITHLAPPASACKASPPRAYLLPAACLHFYPKLATMDYQPERVLTTRASVFRFENGKWDGSVRLWEHTVREFVAVGDPIFVGAWLKQMSIDALTLAQVTAPARLVPSTDSFFHNKTNLARREFQRRLQTKHELMVRIAGTDTPVASFNYHGSHFTKAFGFDRSGTVVTACVGFGMERWLLFA